MITARPPSEEPAALSLYVASGGADETAKNVLSWLVGRRSAAPGFNILALAPGDSYEISTGTSVAAAHVSGVAALLLQHESALKPKDIRAILTATAKPLAGAGQRHSDSEAGLVDPCAALASVDKTSAKR
jgi:subtilisin family serine protease